MKIGYILAVLFFPAFVLINLESSEASKMKVEETVLNNEIDLTNYNFRANSAEEAEFQIPEQTPKNSDYNETKVTPKILRPSAPKVEEQKVTVVEKETEVISSSETNTTNEASKINHLILDKILKANVSKSGKVNYKGIKSQVKDLQAYLDLVSKNEPSKDWSEKEQLAYWINAYNAFTIKLIVDNYPLKSITDLEGGKPWDKKWIQIGGKKYSLNNIENDIIRVQFNEPRIHFAVNCAALSCPPLLNEAWTSSNLDSNLERQTINFINNKSYNQIDPKSASISKIFDWYKEDFGDLITFLNRFSSISLGTNASISFKAYDWTLNE